LGPLGKTHLGQKKKKEKKKKEQPCHDAKNYT
jgi:hypothetical protein